MSAPDRVDDSQPVEHQPDERELLREEIEKVREDLGETVEALANKADVKGQLHDKVEDKKEQVHDKVEQVKSQVGLGRSSPQVAALREKLQNPAVPGAIAAVCAVLLLRSILRSRR